MAVGFGGLHVRDAVGMSEHGVDSAVGIVRIFDSESVAEVRQGAQPRAAHFLDQLDQKERIFADRVVILQIDDNILRRRVLGHAPQAVGSTVEVRLQAFCRRKIRANARRAENNGSVHPLLAESNGLLALGAVRGVRAALAIHRHVRDRGPCLLD